jgi:hypothetical protein
LLGRSRVAVARRARVADRRLVARIRRRLRRHGTVVPVDEGVVAGVAASVAARGDRELVAFLIAVCAGC